MACPTLRRRCPTHGAPLTACFPHALPHFAATASPQQARGAGKIKASAVAKLHAEANQGCDKLVPKLRHVLDGATDRFEAYVLRNILTAPAGVTDAALLARAQQPMPSKTSTSAEAPDAERLAELQASVQSAQDEVRLARKRRRDLTQTVRMLRKRVPALREAADALAAGASTAVSRGTTAHGQAPQAVQDAAAQAKALHIACRQLRSASASLQPGSAAAATAADTAGGPASTSDSPTAAWRAAQGEWNAARAELSGDPSELASMGAALSGGTTSRTTS